MQRCFDLARLGAGKVSPNPMVGAVLVVNDRIIGEGYHAAYGEAHAEVMAVRSVAERDRTLISKATLFVSLEPCCIFGKTPPCTDLIRRERIPRVVISCLDMTPGVSGKSIEILRKSGVEVVLGVLEKEGKHLVRFRDCLVRKHRPYVVLKVAQTRDGFVGIPGQKFWITDPFTSRLTHKWRSEFAGILIGSTTALTDDPELTTRHFPGRSPLRIVVDRRGRLPHHLKLLSDELPAWIVTQNPGAFRELPPQKRIIDISGQDAPWPVLFEELRAAGCNSLLVEGGPTIQEDLLRLGLADECRVLRSTHTLDQEGVPVPPSLPDSDQAGTALLHDHLFVI